MNPSKLEKAFDEALEWTADYVEFEKARSSMMRSTLSRKYGKKHHHEFYAYLKQAIDGDATSKSKPWLRVNDSKWQSHRNLAGMTREKAMQQAVDEVEKGFAMRLLC